MSEVSKVVKVKASKRFIIRKSWIGKGFNVKFTDYDGEEFEYSHDKVYEFFKERFDNMKTFQKYKYYSQSFHFPKFILEEMGEEEALVK